MVRSSNGDLRRIRGQGKLQVRLAGEFTVWGFRLRAWDPRFRVEGLGFKFRIKESGVQGLECTVSSELEENKISEGQVPICVLWYIGFSRYGLGGLGLRVLDVFKVSAQGSGGPHPSTRAKQTKSSAAHKISVFKSFHGTQTNKEKQRF